jgi:hypothetical protein
MRCYQIDPTQDPRWAELADRHPEASIFHSVAWLNALRRTYGYEPVAFTTSSPTGELNNGLVFCHVNSWLTGNRLVSLPFSDHCEPLFDSAKDLSFLIRYLQASLERNEWEYLEVRPVNANLSRTDNGVGFVPTATYLIHTIDLRPDLDAMFRNLDRDSVQRQFERAEQAGLVEKCGTSGDLLEEFYPLLVMTRDREHLPPPPYVWFRNLAHCYGRALEIRVAYRDETPVAAILTVRFRDVVYYKYGCLDARFNQLGAMPWLLWRAIAAAKSNGANEFDMGRTEENNAGLLAFKNHWVPHPKRLVYWRYSDNSQSHDSADSWKLKMAKGAFSHMPSGLLTMAGKLLYRHIG